MDSFVKMHDESFVVETNPLLINTIIERVMEFLPNVEDIMNCRMVCHKWNYFAEPLLKKLGTIVFNTSFRPSNFLKDCSQQPHHQSQPFTAFRFPVANSMSEKRKDERWTLFEVYEFFIKWGKYIKRLELSLQTVWINRDDSHPIKELNIDNLLELFGVNLEKLVLSGCIKGGLNVELSLNTLSSVKNICLFECYINVNSVENRITSSKIQLLNVIFRQNGKTKPNTIINDVVDFSKCSDIVIKNHKMYRLDAAKRCTITFDFSRDSVNSKQIEFNCILPLNVKTSKTKTDRLLLYNGRIEAVQIQLKELEVKICKIELSLISRTVEKLSLKQCEILSLDNHPPLDLPNLKFLNLSSSRSGTQTNADIYKMVSLFVNCTNLIDLELTVPPFEGRANNLVELDVNCLPKTIKILKLGSNHGLKFVGSGNPIEVDVLVVDESENSSSIENVLERIKTKVLIRASVNHRALIRDEPKNNVSEFIGYFVDLKELEKTIIGLKNGNDKLIHLSLDKNKYYNTAGKVPSMCHEFVGEFISTEDPPEIDYFINKI